MRMLLIGALLAVELGSPFGSASATAQPTTPGRMELEITVEAPASSSVVVHLVEPGGEQQTVALNERAPGVFGAVVEVAAVDLVAVYEVVGSAAQSTPVRLTDLGVAREVVGLPGPSPSTVPDDGGARETRQWGWLALALGFSSLALIAVWVLVGGRREHDDLPGEDSEQPSV